MATVIKKTNNNKLIKLNKKKIAIWSTVALLFTVGLSLTLYFTLRPNKAKWPSSLEQLTVDEAIDITLGEEHADEVFGIYIGSTDSDEGCPHCHEAIYGTTDLTDSSEINGEFSKYIEEVNDVRTMNWFSIESNSINSANQDLLDYVKGIYGEGAYIANPDILLLPGTDEEIKELLNYTDIKDFRTDNSVSINPNTGEIIGSSTDTSTEGTDTTTDETTDDGSSAETLSIPAFLWIYDHQIYAMSIGFTQGVEDENGEITEVPQSDKFWFYAEEIINDITTI